MSTDAGAVSFYRWEGGLWIESELSMDQDGGSADLSLISEAEIPYKAESGTLEGSSFWRDAEGALHVRQPDASGAGYIEVWSNFGGGTQTGIFMAAYGAEISQNDMYGGDLSVPNSCQLYSDSPRMVILQPGGTGRRLIIGCGWGNADDTVRIEFSDDGISMPGLPPYASNAAALADGRVAGTLYYNSGIGALSIVQAE